MKKASGLSLFTSNVEEETGSPTTKRPHVANVGRRVANLDLYVYPLNAKFPRSVFLNRDSFPFTEISRIIEL